MLSPTSSFIEAIRRNHIVIAFCNMHLQWVSADFAISVNEAANAVSKTAATLSLHNHDLPLSLSELRSKLSSSILTYWQIR